MFPPLVKNANAMIGWLIKLWTQLVPAPAPVPVPIPVPTDRPSPRRRRR